MKLFLKEILIILFFTFIIGEFIVRMIDVVPDIPERVNYNGYYMLKKNQSGKYIKGKFPKWLKANYHINNLGFVSSKDYFFDDSNNKIAIIGDSFVEGFQVDSDKSIGRLIENELNNTDVYEFGFSGYNYHNYKEIFHDYNLKCFKYVFIILDYEDLSAANSDKIIYSKSIQLKEMFFRKLYDYLFFFKYLNWNHAIIGKLLNIFSFSPEDQNKLNTNIEVFSENYDNLEFVLKSNNDKVLIDIFPKINFIQINHELKPYDFGFDKHWNLNGRKNVAETLIQWIKNQKK